MLRYAMCVAALATASCAASTPADETELAARDCFNSRSINGFSVVDRDTVKLSVGANKEYLATVRGASCYDLQWSQEIAVEASGGSNWMCAGDYPFTGEITTKEGRTCYIDALARVVEEDAAETADEPAEG